MFKTWLVANLEIAYIVCALIVLGLSAFFLPFGGQEGPSVWFFALAGIGVISFPILMAAEPRFGPVINIFILAGLYIFLIYTLKHPEDGSEVPEKLIRVMNTIVISFSIICSIPAFFIARYAYINFDDVVSSRWLYRNSAKDVFEEQWKYTFNRFCMSFLLVLCLLFDIAFVIVVTMAEHSGAFDTMLQ